MSKKSDKKEERTNVGSVPVACLGRALFLTYGGGDFELGDVKGSAHADASGTSLIVYVGDKTYQVLIEDVIRVVVEHQQGSR